MMQNAFWILSLTLAVASLAAAGYQAVLCAVGLLPRWHRAPGGTEPRLRLAVVVPAHNEEAVLGQTLTRLTGQDYPRHLLKTFVIADNCTDDTAGIALRSGAHCLVRSDLSRRGKGHALEWGIPTVLAEGFDAIMVLDADCELSPGAVRALERAFTHGCQAAQISYRFANPDESTISYALVLANRIENDFFYVPRARLGLPVMLRGTGMAFTAALLSQVPWQAASVTEDLEYSLALLRRGIRVRFVEEAEVLSPSPVTSRQQRTQRTRWVTGGVRALLTASPGLVARGVLHARLSWVELAISMFVASRFLVALLFAAAATLTVSGAVLWPTVRWWVPAWCLLLSTAAYLAILVAGAISLGVTRRRLRLALGFPLVAAQYLAVAAAAAFSTRRLAWTKTPR